MNCVHLDVLSGVTVLDGGLGSITEGVLATWASCATSSALHARAFKAAAVIEGSKRALLEKLKDFLGRTVTCNAFKRCCRMSAIVCCCRSTCSGSNQAPSTRLCNDASELERTMLQHSHKSDRFDQTCFAARATPAATCADNLLPARGTHFVVERRALPPHCMTHMIAVSCQANAICLIRRKPSWATRHLRLCSIVIRRAPSCSVIASRSPPTSIRLCTRSAL